MVDVAAVVVIRLLYKLHHIGFVVACRAARLCIARIQDYSATWIFATPRTERSQ